MTGKKYAVAIDQGTTSTRCMVFDGYGNVVGVDQMEHKQIYPKPGWVEHDPLEIWSRPQDAAAEAPIGPRGGPGVSTGTVFVMDDQVGDP